MKRRRWQFIVVHNSGTRQGNARVFDYYHKHVRRMQNGLAYHFVIGNGTSTGNGQIEVGDRWRRQINGGHVHSDYLNNISLGICLVGDFNRDQPTRAQLDACEELIRYLRDRCGKTEQRHDTGEATPRNEPTALADGLPGRRFSLFVVPQVLAALRHPERERSGVERSREVTDGFATGSLDFARNDKRVTCAWRRSDSLPCNSIGNRIRSRAAADWFVGRVRAAGADNVV